MMIALLLVLQKPRLQQPLKIWSCLVTISCSVPPSSSLSLLSAGETVANISSLPFRDDNINGELPFAWSSVEEFFLSLNE